MRDELLRSMPNVAMALFILHERFESAWKPYLDSLPNDFRTPLYFDIEQLNRLKSSATFGKILSFFRLWMSNGSETRNISLLFRRCFDAYSTDYTSVLLSSQSFKSKIFLLRSTGNGYLKIFVSNQRVKHHCRNWLKISHTMLTGRLVNDIAFSHL